jgi:hypothetical protein
MYVGNKSNQWHLAEITILLRKTYYSGKRNLCRELLVLLRQEILSRGKHKKGSVYINVMGALNRANMLGEQTS